MPQHLELGDVIAFGLGALDLTFLAAGCVLGWWCALAVANALVVRLVVASPFVLGGILLGVARVDERPCRTWLVLAFEYASRARVLVTGSC